VTNSWETVNAHNNLWIFFIGLEHFERNRLIEDVGSVRDDGGCFKSDVVSGQRISITAYDLKLTRILIKTLESNEEPKTVFFVGIFVTLEDFNFVVETIAALHCLLVDPVGPLVEWDFLREGFNAVLVDALNFEATREWWRGKLHLRWRFHAD
jgi:hypothetical protein